MYAMPPPPPLPPRWAIPPLHGARSYLALGGVGDFLNPDFGGVSVEGQATFRFFNVSGVDGALTVNILDDLSFAEVSAGYPAFESIAGGIGFDFGFFKALQLGPRLDFGYGSDVTGTIPLYGAFVSFGGHLIGWVNRFIGIYADVDGLFALETFAPNGVRFAAGLAFSVD